MFKWLRDARYNDVIFELQRLRGAMAGIDLQIKSLETRINSIQGSINRNAPKKKEQEADVLEGLTQEERDFIAGLPPWEQEALAARIKNSDISTG